MIGLVSSLNIGTMMPKAQAPLLDLVPHFKVKGDRVGAARFLWHVILTQGGRTWWSSHWTGEDAINAVRFALTRGVYVGFPSGMREHAIVRLLPVSR